MEVSSLEDLSRIDDGGAFHRLVEEAEKRSSGDLSLRDQLLTQWVVVAFCKRIKADTATPGEDQPLLLNLNVPKKPRKPRFCVRVRVGFGGPTASKPQKETLNLLQEQGFPGNYSSATSAITTAASGTSSKKRRRPERERTAVKEEKKSKKRRKATRSAQEVEQLREMGRSLELPDGVRAKMGKLGGTDPVLVITKYIYYTDVSNHHGRFSLPLGQLEVGKRDGRFLKEEEWGMLEEGIKVGLVGPRCSEPTELKLKRWKMQNGAVLALTESWGKFMAKYNEEHPGVLKEGEAVQVWASRCNGGTDVLLALVAVDAGAAAAGGRGGNELGGDVDLELRLALIL